MKWYNADKTRMIDIECVNSFTYRQPALHDMGDMGELRVNVNGNVEMLYGDDATQVFKLLIESPVAEEKISKPIFKKSKKVLLNG